APAGSDRAASRAVTVIASGDSSFIPVCARERPQATLPRMAGPEGDEVRALVPARPLTRRDVARLHRHRLDDKDLHPWMARAAQLKSPWAPPGVDLAANGTGWLLRVSRPTLEGLRRT